MGILAETQQGFKKSTAGLGLLILKLVSAAAFAYILALIGRGLLIYETFAFWFVFMVCFGVYFRITKGWAFLGVIVLNLILFLTGLLLRMYVLVAPGA